MYSERPHLNRQYFNYKIGNYVWINTSRIWREYGTLRAGLPSVLLLAVF